jgi:hypothetical protein
MKKILYIFTFLACSISVNAQILIGLEYGHISIPFNKNDKLVLGDDGYSIGLNTDIQYKKRYGWNLGFEFSEIKEEPLKYGYFFCGTGLTQSDLDRIQNGYFFQRYSFKIGAFFVPVQRQKLTWKIGFGAHYFLESNKEKISGDILNEIKEKYNLSLVLKNIIQYQVAKKTFINLNQSFDIDDYNRRLQYGVGVSYKL